VAVTIISGAPALDGRRHDSGTPVLGREGVLHLHVAQAGKPAVK